jgi:hypothetical protein
MTITLGAFDKYPERNPALMCEAHWKRVVGPRRMWAIVWTGTAILEDRRFIAALGLKEGSKPSRGQVDRALAESPACCRLGSRFDHLTKKEGA